MHPWIYLQKMFVISGWISEYIYKKGILSFLAHLPLPKETYPDKIYINIRFAGYPSQVDLYIIFDYLGYPAQ